MILQDKDLKHVGYKLYNQFTVKVCDQVWWQIGLQVSNQVWFRVSNQVDTQLYRKINRL